MYGFHITAGKRWGYTSANDFLRKNMEGDQWDSTLFLTSWFMLCPIWQLRQCRCSLSMKMFWNSKVFVGC